MKIIDRYHCPGFRYNVRSVSRINSKIKARSKSNNNSIKNMRPFIFIGKKSIRNMLSFNMKFCYCSSNQLGLRYITQVQGGNKNERI